MSRCHHHNFRSLPPRSSGIRALYERYRPSPREDRVREVLGRTCGCEEDEDGGHMQIVFAVIIVVVVVVVIATITLTTEEEGTTEAATG